MKRSSPFLVCSLIIHVGALLLAMLLWVEPLQPPLLPPEFDVEFFRFVRPKTLPREPIKTPVEQPPEPLVQAVPPSTPKPKPAVNMDWTVTETLPSGERDAMPARPNEPSIAETITGTPHGTPSAHDKLQSEGIQAVNLPQIDHGNTSDIPVERSNVVVAGVEKELNADSPDIELDELKYWHRRGGAIDGTSMGNSSAGGGGGMVATGTPIHLDMMNAIGRDIAEAATARQVDLVFVIDKTGSMRDNVRGIRAYVDTIFNRLTRAGHDTAVGLVTFGEVKISKLKARGVTTDHGAFKNWLHKVKIEGGGDFAESCLDALVTAQTKIKFRRGAQRFFVLASDGPFHDADYDGKSRHSLDDVIASLQREEIRVDVIGIDYLPVKQLAWGTGGKWRKIPGSGVGEYTIPITLTAKMLSAFGALNFKDNSLNDELIVQIPRDSRPKRITVTLKVLNPLGERCYGPVTERLDTINEKQTVVRLNPVIDTAEIRRLKGTYTVIYRLENDLGHRSILRRTFDWAPLEIVEGKTE